MEKFESKGETGLRSLADFAETKGMDPRHPHVLELYSKELVQLIQRGVYEDSTPTNSGTMRPLDFGTTNESSLAF